MPPLSKEDWKTYIAAHPDAHLLQTAEWGALKSEFGWDAEHFVEGENGVQVLFRRVPLGFSLAYIPKGPAGGALTPLMPAIDAACRARRAFALIYEPDAWEGDGGQETEDGEGMAGKPGPGEAATGLDVHQPSGFEHAGRPVQPPRTITVDLRGDEDSILERMKQKTRYNIRLGLRKGVVVRETGDLATFNALMEETGEREAFGVHSLAYYERAYALFKPHDMCELLIAEAEGTPLAALMVFARGERAWYLYGASSREHRNYMPTYVLQWEAMRWARTRGCTEYDLWGVPDEDAEALEAGFTKRTDGLWGVYRFKRGFGGEVRRSTGPWVRVYSRLLYGLYERLGR
jgi:lipid II:glycine glycyltransferase (peptidoglycan interpeptide bridge formation enzyme)